MHLVVDPTPACGATLDSRGLFYREKAGWEALSCFALRPAPRSPSTHADRFARSARHDARRVKLHVVANSQLFPPSTPTNSSAWPRSKDLPPRPIPPHSDPLALPIYTSEPSTLRHAHAVKRSHKHHEKPQTVSYPSLPQLSLRYFSLNLELIAKQHSKSPGNPSVFRRSSGIWPAMGVSDSFGAGEAGDRTSELRQAGDSTAELRRVRSSSAELRQARSSQAKQRRASAITVGLRGCSQHRRQPAWRYKPSRERGTCEG